MITFTIYDYGYQAGRTRAWLGGSKQRPSVDYVSNELRMRGWEVKREFIEEYWKGFDSGWETYKRELKGE